MSQPTVQNSFISGELSPEILGRTEKAEYRNGASTMRNLFVNYRGGAMSRGGLKYVGMCKQGAPNSGGTATSNPPRDIPFQYNINQGFSLEFGDTYMRVKYQGAYVTESAKNITGATNANPLVITSNAHGYSNGDWVSIVGMGGMTNLNSLVWVVTNVTTNTFQLTDLFGATVNSTTFGTYTSGGTASRIYTVVSPYAAIDLPFLKFTQSQNTMYLTCWNQNTNAAYAPYTLVHNGNTNWTFTAASFASAISPPSSVAATATSSTTANTWYSYVVTSVDVNGNESVASVNVDILNNDIAVNAGSNTLTWAAVSGAVSYNVYATQPAFTTTPYNNPGFVGNSYGYVGTALGLQFIDTNITPDSTRTPPTHTNPFAVSSIAAVTVTAQGSGYTQSTTSYTVTTSTGSGFKGTPIIQSGKLTGFIIYDGGSGYANGDSINITSSGGGTSATVSITLGPSSGTYPGVCQYFQQRLVYANSINNPNTYWMSQPGLPNNFNVSIPVIDSDAITGTPWGVQTNGIQFLLPTINGLLTFTGNGVWLVNGGSATAITPSDQNAQAQAQIGCSSFLPPLYLNLHVLYVQAKNSVVRDIAYNFLYNVFQGQDITVFSNHLFSSNTLTQWAYAEEPYKVVWAVRNDGAMLSLTYVKEQEIQGWARHDTNGQFIGVCSIIEQPLAQGVSYTNKPPTDTIYTIVKRYIVGKSTWVYYAERMDTRVWQNVEDSFCVDAGLAYPMTYPNATLTPASLTGTNNITSVNLISGGSNYTAPVISAFDPTGSGSGATFTYTLSGGVITTITPVATGSNYAQGTYLIITDSTGNGAVANAIVTNYVTFTASSAVFSPSNVGNIIRVDGGKATIVTYNSSTSVLANVTTPLTNYVLNDPNLLPTPATAGTWSLSVPTTTVSGLNHLEGMTVSILADGGVNPPQVVTNGSVTLQTAASSIVIGLPFTAQLQAMYLDPQTQGTIQGKRKDITAMTLRVSQTRGVQVGTNQPDASFQPNFANVTWQNMEQIQERNLSVQAGQNLPLFSGDVRVLLPGSWDERGQVCVQTSCPLPANILALIPEFAVGDASA